MLDFPRSGHISQNVLVTFKLLQSRFSPERDFVQAKMAMAVSSKIKMITRVDKLPITASCGSSNNKKYTSHNYSYTHIFFNVYLFFPFQFHLYYLPFQFHLYYFSILNLQGH